jgi:hypothetical protein
MNFKAFNIGYATSNTVANGAFTTAKGVATGAKATGRFFRDLGLGLKDGFIDARDRAQGKHFPLVRVKKD